MPNNDNQWFITERSEALASLMLTSRSDLAVVNEKRKDSGADFVVGIVDNERLTTRLFAVQVKGTMSSEKSVWTENVKPLFKRGNYYLPVCVFVMNVQKNEAAYAWVAEPKVENNSAKLYFTDQPEFHPLDLDAVEKIVDSVRSWYDVMPHSSTSNRQ